MKLFFLYKYVIFTKFVPSNFHYEIMQGINKIKNKSVLRIYFIKIKFLKLIRMTDLNKLRKYGKRIINNTPLNCKISDSYNPTVNVSNGLNQLDKIPRELIHTQIKDYAQTDPPIQCKTLDYNNEAPVSYKNYLETPLRSMTKSRKIRPLKVCIVDKNGKVKTSLDRQPTSMECEDMKLKTFNNIDVNIDQKADDMFMVQKSDNVQEELTLNNIKEELPNALNLLEKEIIDKPRSISLNDVLSSNLEKIRWTEDMIYFVKCEYEICYDWEKVTEKFSKKYKRIATSGQIYQKMRRWIPTLNRDLDPDNNLNFILWANGIYKLWEYIDLQIKEYNKNGRRLYSFKDFNPLLKIAEKKFKRYTKEYLTQLYGSKENGNFYYDLLFGKLHTSYQDILRKCKKVKYTLKKPGSQAEWLEMLKHRGKIPPSWLYIKVKCKKGHTRTKRISSLDNALSVKAKGCKLCQYENMEISIDDCKKLAKKKGIKFGLDKEQFKAIIAEGKARGILPSLIPLKWKCPNPDCGYEWWRSTEFTHSNLPGCSICNERSNKNQIITFKLCKFLFEDFLPCLSIGYDRPLSRIFETKSGEELAVYMEYQFYCTVHFDIFIIIKINNRTINLAIEQQGKQHENSEAGWKYFYNLSRKEASMKDWKYLLHTDKKKGELMYRLNNINLYKINGEEYYLIQVWYNLDVHKRQEFIVKQFKDLTGIDLSYKPYFDPYNLSK